MDSGSGAPSFVARPGGFLEFRAGEPVTVRDPAKIAIIRGHRLYGRKLKEIKGVEAPKPGSQAQTNPMDKAATTKTPAGVPDEVSDSVRAQVEGQGATHDGDPIVPESDGDDGVQASDDEVKTTPLPEVASVHAAAEVLMEQFHIPREVLVNTRNRLTRERVVAAGADAGVSFPNLPKSR